MAGVVRIGDRISCGDTMGQGSPNVFANGIAVSRTGIDKTRGHCFNPVPMIQGSPSVFINNHPVNMIGGAIPPHRCRSKVHAGRAVTGSTNVFANVGGPASEGPPTEEQQQQVIAENVDEARQPTATRFDFAYTITDDHEAPTIGPAAPAVLEYRKQVEAEEGPTSPQTPVQITEVSPPPGLIVLPTDCSDIESHVGPFPGTFPLSTNYILSDLTTNTVVSNYKIKDNAGLTEKQIVCNLRQVCNNILEPLRMFYPEIVVNSGFRTNGGRSQHERGQAVDVAFPSIQTDVDAMFLRAQTIVTQVKFDQMIFERARTFWIHLSFTSPLRGQQLTLVYGTTNRYVPGIVKTTT